MSLKTQTDLRVDIDLDDIPDKYDIDIAEPTDRQLGSDKYDLPFDESLVDRVPIHQTVKTSTDTVADEIATIKAQQQRRIWKDAGKI